MDRQLGQAERFLDRRITEYFCQMLPSTEHWRMFDRFKDDCAYLDIETDGQYAHANVTMVSVHLRGRTTTLVKGEDLDASSVQRPGGRKMLVRSMDPPSTCLLALSLSHGSARLPIT